MKEIKCSICGKVTKHYLSKKGEYKCLICGTANKKVAPKKDLEVIFEIDEEFDNQLNPIVDSEIEKSFTD